MKKLISFAVCLMLAFTLCLTACTGGTGKVADNTEHLTAVTQKCKLTKTYEGKSFLQEGIGEAVITRFVDGDTMAVNLPVDDVTVMLRFHSVDTPESTGGVEKWGKAASLFVKDQLSKAEKVVVEATAVPAEKDSYGTRWLAYVWYRQSASEPFKNLNLELVENGYSLNKGIDTPKFPYNSYFKQAENAARAIKLRLFSEKEDPLYSTDPVDVTIKDILENTEQYYNAEFDSGSKVRFSAAITDIIKSPTGTTTFVATYFDEEGKKYEIDVYAGYASASASQMPVGHLYRVVGTIQMHNDKLQVSGITYNAIFGESNMEYTHPTQRNYYLTFDSTVTYRSNYSATLYTDVTVVSSSVENGTLTIVGTAYKRTKDGQEETPTTFTFNVAVAEGYVNNFVEGDTFSVRGYQYIKDSGIITIIDLADIN